MSISFIESACTSCGAKQRIDCNTWGYGSPIVTCRSCGAEYLERQLREPAAEGLVPVTSNTSAQIKGVLVCLAFTLAGALCYALFTVNRLLMLAMAVFGFFGMIYFITLLIKNKSGAAERENRKYMEESERRLSDRSYAEKLRAYGYDVPERFLK